MIDSPHPDAPTLVEEIASGFVTGVSRSGQAALKAQCLKRDGYKCVVTRFPDRYTGNDIFFPTECTHIVPFGIGEEKYLVRCHLHHCIYAVTYIISF